MATQLTLKYADRARKLKVVGVADHLCEYSNEQLAKFGVDEGVELEIVPDFVSEVIVQVKGKERLLGYTDAMELLLKDKRLTDLKPGEQGTISGYEGGHNDKIRFTLLGLEKSKKVQLVRYKFCYDVAPRKVDLFLYPDLVPGDQYVLVEGVRKVGLPAVAYVLVETEEGEKQLPFMEKGEEGAITEVIVPMGEEELYDKLWIKKGSHVRVLYREEPRNIPLMVSVRGEEHIIGAGLTDKIFVKYSG